jgi:hypothetical protein
LNIREKKDEQKNANLRLEPDLEEVPTDRDPKMSLPLLEVT